MDRWALPLFAKSDCQGFQLLQVRQKGGVRINIRFFGLIEQIRTVC